jgi:3-deoxy-D-manno-octulosonate 8-phosphate phosphatase (KDO 8-P phosphatase)
MSAVAASAKDIRLIISDVDGVWTDGKIVYAGDTREIKAFNVRDGLAAKLAQKCGMIVALLTSRESPALARRARELGIEQLHQGSSNKLDSCEQILRKLDLHFEQIVYLGDDLPDLAPMLRAGISAAPADAAAEVFERAKWKLKAIGGNGAFREAVERLLRERGQWQSLIEDFESGKPDAKSL